MRKNPTKSTPALRVLIRPPTMDDCAAFLAAVRRSRDLHGAWVAPKAITRAQFAEYIERFDGKQRYGFLVVHRESGELVGMININDVIRGDFQSASLGYYAFSPHAGQGLMFEGMQLVIANAFRKLMLHRLEANIQPGNRASIALVKKCGFVCEGRSRRLLKISGKWRDHERWAILAEDFAKVDRR
jgi:ribosomal-protein-alanine N-acetyltransferase